MKKYNMSLFHELLSATQEELLFDIMPKKFNKLGMADQELIGDCLFVHGNVPVMLVAHLDIVSRDNNYPENFIYGVNKDGKETICANNRTLGGDDRCGQYIILEALDELVKKGIKPYVLCTTDEERGCVGASQFVKAMPLNEYEIKFVIELDRRGKKDIVFYDCDGHKEFMEFAIEHSGYERAIGSYSDIVEITDAWKICSCNLSCGYYNEHTAWEYVVIDEMLYTRDVVVKWLSELNYDEVPMFEYVDNRKNYDDDYYAQLACGYGYTTEELEDLTHGGTSYSVCADCGTLVPMDDRALRYGICLCESCQEYYDDVLDKNCRHDHVDDELDGYTFADEPDEDLKGLSWKEIIATLY